MRRGIRTETLEPLLLREGGGRKSRQEGSEEVKGLREIEKKN